MHRRRKSAALAGAIIIVSVLPTFVRAHMGDQFNSVHFHSGEVDFGQIPRRARSSASDDRLGASAMDDISRVGVELEDTSDKEHERDQNRARALGRADAMLSAGEWRPALMAYRAAITRFGPSGVVRDRAEIAERLLKIHADPESSVTRSVKEYLVAVATDDTYSKDAAVVLERLAADEGAGFLREHALYQRACLAFDVGQTTEAVTLFRRQLASYPHSTKSEAGLIMQARCSLLTEPPEEQLTLAGSEAAETLLRRFPHSRFRNAALGLRGRVHLIRRRYRQALSTYVSIGDTYSIEKVRDLMPAGMRPADLRPALLAGYLKRLAGAKTYAQYRAALSDIDRTRTSFDTRDSEIFSRMLALDTTLPAPYLYYRLYHTECTPVEIERLARLTGKILRAHPETRLPPLVLVRFGEVDYFRKRYREAARWADRALSADHGRSEAAARALYVRGASREKLHRYRPALNDFQALLRQYPGSPLRRGALEELAILYEDVGDLSRALDQYFTLGYQADIAFFLDARMSVREVEQYLATHPDVKYRDVALSEREYDRADSSTFLSTHELITYTLGVRYMRMEQWSRAARLLRRVPARRYTQYSVGRRKDAYVDNPSPDPLTVCRSLSMLQRSIRLARGDNDRAAAQYRYANYIYSHGSLLFYVAPLWEGSRASDFSYFWNKRHATADDKRAAEHHMIQHEIYAQSLKAYTQIARWYPHTPSAPKALYRAACSAWRQSRFNWWWRDREKKFGYRVQASRLMATLAKRYPKHPLAKEAAKFSKVFLARESDY